MMVWELTNTCFTTGSVSDLECLLSQGFSSIFGSGPYELIFFLIVGIVLSWKMRAPLDLSIVFIVSLVWIGSLVFVPTWFFYMTIIFVAAIVGWGFYKWYRR